jgi:hypothetical protein
LFSVISESPDDSIWLEITLAPAAVTQGSIAIHQGVGFFRETLGFLDAVPQDLLVSFNIVFQTVFHDPALLDDPVPGGQESLISIKVPGRDRKIPDGQMNGCKPKPIRTP